MGHLRHLVDAVAQALEADGEVVGEERQGVLGEGVVDLLPVLVGEAVPGQGEDDLLFVFHVPALQIEVFAHRRLQGVQAMGIMAVIVFQGVFDGGQGVFSGFVLAQQVVDGFLGRGGSRCESAANR